MWLEDHGLEPAKNKTKVTPTTMANILLEISMQIGDVSLVTKMAVRYLGLRLDCRLNYWAQIQHATTKAAKLTGMSSRQILADQHRPSEN